MNTVILKFGGTSVADNEKLKTVADKIVKLKEEQYDIVVVVSAQGKKTDELLAEAYELSNNPSNRELDMLLSTGEQMSVSKLSILLNEMGYKAIALTGWQAGIYTNNVNQNAIIDHIDTYRINKELANDNIVIVAGFQGINDNEDITTLGRGGSDTTAVSVAAALNAKSCYIYSDVEGVFTTDPRKYAEAVKLEEVSYDEMLDIANEGAKVLHNRCVEIGKKFNIPIVAKSTFKEDKGTIVNNKIEAQKVKSIVKDDELVLVKINKENWLCTKMYKFFIDNQILPTEFIENSNEVHILVKSNLFVKFNNVFKDKLTYTYEKVSRISIIGYGISNDTNIVQKVIDILQGEEGNIQKIDINNGKIRATFKTVIGNDILDKIHKTLL